MIKARLLAATALTVLSTAALAQQAGPVTDHLLGQNNLSDVANPATALANIGGQKNTASDNGVPIGATCFGDSRCSAQGIFSQLGTPAAYYSTSNQYQYLYYQRSSASPFVIANALLGDRLNMDMRYGYMPDMQSVEQAYIVTNGGSGYTSAPTATSPCSAGGSNPAYPVSAPGAVTVSGGKVVSVALGTRGYCSSYPPGYLTLSGGGGTGATVEIITNYGGDYGISGQTSTDMVGRLADVEASPAHFIELWCCTNDPSNSISLAQSEANWLAIVTGLVNTDHVVLAHTDMPRTQLSAYFTGTTSIAATAANQQFLLAHDSYKRMVGRQQYGNTYNFNGSLIVLPQGQLMGDPTSANDEPIAKVTKEGLHPSTYGAIALGTQLAQSIAPLIGYTAGGFNSDATFQNDAWDPVNNPQGYLLGNYTTPASAYFNPFMTLANTGSPFTSAPACTGTAAKGVSVQLFYGVSASSGGTDSCAFSLANRVDGYPGKTQHWVFSLVPASGALAATQTSHTVLQMTAANTACQVGLAVGAEIHGGTLPTATAANPAGGSIISAVTAATASSGCLVTVPSNQGTTALDASGTVYTWGSNQHYYRWQPGTNHLNWGINSGTFTNSASGVAGTNTITISAMPNNDMSTPAAMTAQQFLGVGIYGGSLAWPKALPAVVTAVSGSGPYTLYLDQNLASGDAAGTTYTFGDRVRCKAELYLTNMQNMNFVDFKFNQIQNGSPFNVQAQSQWGGQNGDFLPDSVGTNADSLRNISGKLLTLSTYPVMVPPGSGTVAIAFNLGVDGALASSFTADISNVLCRKAQVGEYN